MKNRKYLLEPKSNDIIVIPNGYGKMEYLNEKIGWRQSPYYMEDGHIYLDNFKHEQLSRRKRKIQATEEN